MIVIKPSCMALTTRPLSYRQRRGLCIGVMMFLRTDREGLLALGTETGLWPFLGSQFGEAPVIDAGVPKVRAELLVHGAAFHPDGAGTRCAVRATVGSVSKTLVVHGARRRGTDRPAPFDGVPIEWSRAYGGASIDANPIGCGARGDLREETAPQIEYPDRPYVDPENPGSPAGLSMIGDDWPVRARLRGTYDERWLQEDSPGLPGDIDWSFFNSAPADQWFDGELRGDEPFSFENMTPDRRPFEGHLPGFTVRALVRSTEAADEAFVDVPMRLTTVCAFPHERAFVLVSHGLMNCQRPDGSDLGELILGIERIGEPRRLEAYLAVRARRALPRTGSIHSLRDSDLIPVGARILDPDLDIAVAARKLEGHVGKARFRGAQLVVDEVRKKLQAEGIDPDQFGIPPLEETPTPSLDELADVLEARQQQADDALVAQVADLERTAKEAIAKAAAEGAPIADEPRGPPTFRALRALQDLVERVPPGSVGPDGKRFTLDAIAPQMMQMEAAQYLQYRMAAHKQPPAFRKDPAQSADIHRLLDAHAVDRGDRPWDCTGAQLAGKNLDGADLIGIWLESADLTRASLVGAHLADAVLAHSTLSGANFAGADLQGANLGASTIADAVFDRANLAGTVLEGVTLERSSFRRASLLGISWLEVRFRECDFARAVFGNATFLKRDLTGMIFAGADLRKATFVECVLDHVNFAEADLRGATFVDCLLRQAQFPSARLDECAFVGHCVLSDSRFDAATCRSANLRGQLLHRASFARVKFEHADLSEADLTGASLEDADFKGCLFVRSILRDIRARACDFMGSVMQEADLGGADLAVANLYGTDLSLAVGDATTRFTAANLDRARLAPRARVGGGQ